MTERDEIPEVAKDLAEASGHALAKAVFEMVDAMLRARFNAHPPDDFISSAERPPVPDLKFERAVGASEVRQQELDGTTKATGDAREYAALSHVVDSPIEMEDLRRPERDRLKVFPATPAGSIDPDLDVHHQRPTVPGMYAFAMDDPLGVDLNQRERLDTMHRYDPNVARQLEYMYNFTTQYRMVTEEMFELLDRMKSYMLQDHRRIIELESAFERDRSVV